MALIRSLHFFSHISLKAIRTEEPKKWAFTSLNVPLYKNKIAGVVSAELIYTGVQNIPG